MNEATRARTERALGPLLAETSPFRSFWLRLLQSPLAHNDLALVVADDAEVYAVAAVGRRPSGTAQGRLSIVYAVEHPDRSRVYRAINDEILARSAARGVDWHYLVLPEHDRESRQHLLALGYEIFSRALRMTWIAAPISATPAAGVAVQRYAGGNAALSAAAAALYNRYNGAEELWHPVDGAGLDGLIAEGETEWYLALADGRPVGVAQITLDGFFVGIAVARSHWGVGVADHLAGAVMEEMHRRGLQRLSSSVRPSNAASLSLHERMGWVENGAAICYRIKVPQLSARA